MPDSASRSALTLDQYQRRAADTDVDSESEEPIIPLLGLAGEVGHLISEFKKKQRPDGLAHTGFDETVVSELGDILWYLAALARRVRVPLSEIAHVNLVKTRARWLPTDPETFTSFDAGFPSGERLPQEFDVNFSSSLDPDGSAKVRMTIDGVQVGDPIDDNAGTPDYYRYHDAFHLAHAAVLGWSPILRALTGRKRKSDPAIDRAEDGARACATEEAVSAMVFAMAKPYDYFEGVAHIDDLILDAVTTVVTGLEVGQRTTGDWERAILAGFAVWRALREQGGGTVRVDLKKRSILFVSREA